jgi:hypothetical protein
MTQAKMCPILAAGFVANDGANPAGWGSPQACQCMGPLCEWYGRGCPAYPPGGRKRLELKEEHGHFT